MILFLSKFYIFSFQVLIIIVLGLGRGVPLELGTFDKIWLYHGTVVGAAITWIIMIVAYLLGDNLPLRVVMSRYSNVEL